MDTIVSDTHAFVKELTDAGMPESQAEVLARTRAKSIDEKLATKQDLEALEMRLTRRPTIRLGSMMVVAVETVVALVKLLKRSVRRDRLDRRPAPRQIAAPGDAWGVNPTRRRA